MSKWSRGAAQRFVEQKTAKQTQDAKVLHDQEMVKFKSPQIWQEVTSAFSHLCTEFNAEAGIGSLLSFNGSDPNKLKISRADTRAVLTVTFLEAFPVITFDGITEKVRLTFEVLPGTSEVGLFTPHKIKTTPEEVAEATLDMFLGVK